MFDVVLCQNNERPEWDRYVAHASSATICHDFVWHSVINDVYGHRPFYLLARHDNEVAGVLPLFLVKSHLFGNSLTSMPFLDYGGICAERDAVAEQLVRRAQNLMGECGVDYIELRQYYPTTTDGAVRLDKVGMVLDLSPGSVALWRALPAKVRNQVRKAEKSGLTALVGSGELLDDFYPVFVQNMRDLGSPVHHKRFFAQIFTHFGDQVRLVVVRDGTKVVGGLVFLCFRDTVTVPWASSLREYFAKCPNNLLYWEALQYACTRGYSRFDFGRSSVGSGTYNFKKQWGAQAVQLYWQLLSRDGTSKSVSFSAHREKYKIVLELWKRLPLPITQLVGPMIRKYLTN